MDVSVTGGEEQAQAEQPRVFLWCLGHVRSHCLLGSDVRSRRLAARL